MKEAVIPVYFEAIGLPVPPAKKKTGKRKRSAQADEEPEPVVDMAISDAWLKNEQYMKSAKGFATIVKALIKLMNLIGVSYGVVTPKDVGATPYVDCTLRHFALICAMICNVFEKISRVKALRRCGVAVGIFQKYKVEVGISQEFLPTHGKVENGLRLVDGAHAGRGNLGTSSASDEELDELEEELSLGLEEAAEEMGL